MHGFANGRDAGGGIKEFKSSYRVNKGDRPDGFGDPGGKYDGTFVVDYEFIKDAGDLDACNGKRVTTPDFPDGTYAYFLTQDWPVIPRCFNAAPDRSFAKRRGGPPPGGGFGPPPGGPPPHPRGGGFGPPPGGPHPGGPPPHPPHRF